MWTHREQDAAANYQGPQTVSKTAGLSSAAIHQCRPESRSLQLTAHHAKLVPEKQ